MVCVIFISYANSLTRNILQKKTIVAKNFAIAIFRHSPSQIQHLNFHHLRNAVKIRIKCLIFYKRKKRVNLFLAGLKLCGVNIVYFDSIIDIINTILLSHNKKMKKKIIENAHLRRIYLAQNLPFS